MRIFYDGAVYIVFRARKPSENISNRESIEFPVYTYVFFCLTPPEPGDILGTKTLHDADFLGRHSKPGNNRRVRDIGTPPTFPDSKKKSLNIVILLVKFKRMVLRAQEELRAQILGG